MKMTTEKYEYVMQELSECDDDDIAILKKNCFSTLGKINRSTGIGTYMGLPNDSLGQGTINLHKYMVVMNK